jgi:hypothetical protein
MASSRFEILRVEGLRVAITGLGRNVGWIVYSERSGGGTVSPKKVNVSQAMMKQ